jgi:hypothetical protein
LAELITKTQHCKAAGQMSPGTAPSSRITPWSTNSLSQVGSPHTELRAVYTLVGM